MFFSHRFGSVETLSRARYWLLEHGFHVVKADETSHDVSRLTLNVDFSKAAAALALIDSIESSDPDGWPRYTTPSRSLHSRATQDAMTGLGLPSAKAQSPIHWHGGEESSPADAVSAKVREYMFSRWE